MLLRTILITAAIGLLATGAWAQLIVGTDDTTAPIIYHIDVGTGFATPLLATAEAQTWGMAYDQASNTLYWNDGTVLFSSPFSMSGLTPTQVGTITYNGSGISIVGLAFRNGMLLGTRNVSVEAVYEIDPNTAVATQLYVYPSGFDFGGLDVDATNGRLYGLSDATFDMGRGLYEIDTALQTYMYRAPYPAGETDIDGLACYNGLAYYVIDQPGLFYIYDIATGNQVGTITSPWTTSEVFSAAAYVPGGPVSVEESTWGQIKGLYR